MGHLPIFRNIFAIFLCMLQALSSLLVTFDAGIVTEISQKRSGRRIYSHPTSGARWSKEMTIYVFTRRLQMNGAIWAPTPSAQILGGCSISMACMKTNESLAM